MAIRAEVLDPDLASEPDLRDPHDQPVLGTLLAAHKAARVDYLVIGDKDLLALADRYPVITPTDFWAAHGRL